VAETLTISDDQCAALGRVRLLIADVDNTLVFARDRSFYRQYSAKVEEAIAARFFLTAAKAQEVASFYRQTYGGGELALFKGDVGVHFPDVPSHEPDVSTLYDRMITIDPAGEFEPQPGIRSRLQRLRTVGVKVVALTSSPDVLSRTILAESGYNPDADFDAFHGYTREAGPPKILGAMATFQNIAADFSNAPHEVIAVGDMPDYDVLPAMELGMAGCWIDAANGNSDFPGARASHIVPLLDALLVAQGDSVQ